MPNQSPLIDNLLFSGLSYEAIWSRQKIFVDEIASGLRQETIIFCEHELCITEGRRAHAGNLIRPRCPVYQIERGGDYTLHQPGQLVIYPLLKIQDRFSGLRAYLRFCEEVIIQYLISHGLSAGRFGPTGVWVKAGLETKKIASIGIAVRRWISYHGIALNVSNDLDQFKMIRPCDFESSIMTSLSALGISVSIDDAAQEISNLMISLMNQGQAQSLLDQFSCQDSQLRSEVLASTAL